MKLPFYLTVFFLISLSGYSQNDTIIGKIRNQPETSVQDQLLKQSAFNQTDDSLFLKLDTILIDSTKLIKPIDIKANHWNTTVFNPYKNVKPKFPIKLEFSDSSYSSPITRNKVVTSRFGWRNGRGHHGIDIDLITGDSIFSMFSGIVRFARYSTGYGKTIVVRHYNGLETVYAHLSKYAVKANDTVKYGQHIGYGGISGNARGSHLHLGIYYHGIAIYPEYLFEFSAANSVRAKEIWVTDKWTRSYLHNHKKQSTLNIFTTKEEAVRSRKNRKRIYIVKRGDTLSRIALKNNIPITTICKTNYIKSSTILKIGQKLIIE
ncbi:M23 family metallopeptidase [Aquimarina algiphila]|uniref:M23 family metallopeptidase n=1 Tax=Aquimarina algiphila TaxID=2047982 RepID=UPI00248F9409|nr:M23 family metallopeptidase [Aquimarina algiphila]